MSSTLGITLGDPSGIGPEVIAAALQSGRLNPAFQYRVVGERGLARPGAPGASTAESARDALEEAALLAARGEIAGVVTGPIHKARMQAIGFPFPGQTEFFAARTHTANFAMCLTGGALTVALVTAHIPLRDVPESLNPAEIIRVGGLLGEFLRRRGRLSPRIAVAGLNPHAGESGALGREEIETIEPAVKTLQLERPASAIFPGAVLSGYRL